MVTQLTNMTKDSNIFDITFIQHKVVFYMYYMALTNQAPTDNSCKTLDFFSGYSDWKFFPHISMGNLDNYVHANTTYVGHFQILPDINFWEW